jgi:hypothetical protein
MPERAAQMLAFILGGAKKCTRKSVFFVLSARYHESVLYGMSFADTKGKGKSRK